jgi:hypothetical protein
MQTAAFTTRDIQVGDTFVADQDLVAFFRGLGASATLKAGQPVTVKEVKRGLGAAGFVEWGQSPLHLATSLYEIETRVRYSGLKRVPAQT